MFNKNIILRFNEENKSKIKIVADKYAKDRYSQKGIGRFIFSCSRFDIDKIKNDIQLLNDIGLEVSIQIV